MAHRAKGKSAKKKAAKKANPKQASRGRVARAPGMGHNSGQPAPALVKTHHEKLTAIETRMEAARVKLQQIRGEHRSAYAVVKQDGIDLEGFKLARKLDAEDHGIVVTTYSRVGEYLAAIKSELATQMDLFQSIDIPLPANATLAGTQAFANKEPRTNNPFQQGTEEYANFDTAWMAAADKVDLTKTDGDTQH